MNEFPPGSEIALPKLEISAVFANIAVMDKLVSHLSALEYWNTVGAASLPNAAARRKATRRARSLLSEDQKPYLDEGGFRPGGCRLPLSVLVGSDSARVRTCQIVSKGWSSDLPDGSFAEVGSGFLVSTPEFCFLQMARELSLVRLIMLGYELCGSYALVEKNLWDDSEGEKEMKKRNPLTTVSRLESFLAKAEGAFGRKKALRAVKYIVNGSASPRETALAMLLCLPYGLGGFGLPQPMLNYHIDIGKRTAPMADRTYCECDLYWPHVKVAVEYDSDLHHTGSRRIFGDTKRRNTLVAQGVTVVGVTRMQINDVLELRKVAKSLARLTGKRLRCNSPELVRKHYVLRAELSIALNIFE